MIVKHPKITTYPDRFPVPTKVGYAGNVDYGLSRIVMNGGGTQNRYYGSNPTTLNMTFRMTVAEYHDWSSWINEYGSTKWVLMKFVSQYIFLSPGEPLTLEILRFGDQTATPLGGNYLEVQVTAEILPRDIGDGLPGLGGGIHAPLEISDWIVAGDPASPSPDWIVAGAPSTPSADTIYAGAPADHGG